MAKLKTVEIIKWLHAQRNRLHPGIRQVVEGSGFANEVRQRELLVSAAARTARALQDHESSQEISPADDAHVYWAQVAVILAAFTEDADGPLAAHVAELLKSGHSSFADSFANIDEDKVRERFVALLEAVGERGDLTYVQASLLDSALGYARGPFTRGLAIGEHLFTKDFAEARPLWLAAAIIASLKGLVIRLGMISLRDRAALVAAASEPCPEADENEIRKFIHRMFDPYSSYDDLFRRVLASTRHPRLQAVFDELRSIDLERRALRVPMSALN